VRIIKLHKYDDGVEIHMSDKDIHELISVAYNIRMGHQITDTQVDLMGILEEKLDDIINQEPEVNRIIRIGDSYVVEVNDTLVKVYEKSIIGHYVAAVVLPTKRILGCLNQTWSFKRADLDGMFLEE